MTFSVKICGITNRDDALMVSEAGADYLGILVTVSQSPRSVSLERASEIVAAAKVPVIVLTYDHPPHTVLMMEDTLHPSGVQLAGNEDYGYIAPIRRRIKGQLWKSLHIPAENTDPNAHLVLADQINRLAEAGVDKIILDTAITRGNIVSKGGTGQKSDWSLARKIRETVDVPLFLAGGINPQNVKQALRMVQPDGVDVSSGVELSVGKKDPASVKKLIDTVKNIQSPDCGLHGL